MERERGREGGPLSWVKLKIILQKIFYDQARLYTIFKHYMLETLGPSA